MVLAISSEVFKSALINMMTKNENKEMRIEDISPKSVQGMVDFIYTGTVPANIGNQVGDLLHLADKYGLGCLKRACEKSLMDDLVVENAINTIIYAERWP